MKKIRGLKRLHCIFIVGVIIILGLNLINAEIQSSGVTSFIEIDGVNYTTQTFTSNGTFNYTGDDPLNISLLVVAGGGGGGDSCTGASGGGGAGGMFFNNSYYILGNYDIIIGVGGAGGVNDSGDTFGRGGNGGNSYIENLTEKIMAYGGGGGGCGSIDACLSGYINGNNGGSGGGGGFDTGAYGNPIISVMGNRGGNNGGGGGGAGSNGNNGGSAGDGLFNNISGIWTCYAGGGGAGYPDPTANITCGGGSGSSGVHTNDSLAGIDGQGGGGGGAWGWTNSNPNNHIVGKRGGDGLVIIRYKTLSDCTENLINTSWSDALNSSCNTTDLLEENQFLIQYDSNVCNITENITFWNNETFSCDYCTIYPLNITLQDWLDMTPCINYTKMQNSSILTYDFNNDTCYSVTGLESDYFNEILYYLEREVSCTIPFAVDYTLFSIDLESKTTIVIFVFLFIFVILLGYFRKWLFAGGLLVIMGFLLLFNSFNLIVSFIIIASGVIAFFLK